MGVLKSNLDPVVRKWGEQWLEPDALVNAPSAEEFVSDVQYKGGFAALEVSDESRVGACRRGSMKCTHVFKTWRKRCWAYPRRRAFGWVRIFVIAATPSVSRVTAQIETISFGWLLGSSKKTSDWLDSG